MVIALLRSCSCATRDIVLQHMWEGRTPAEEPVQVEHSLEQPVADRGPAEASSNSIGMHMQASLFPTCARLKGHL